MRNFAPKVYNVVKRIPAGKVATYSQIAKKIKIQNSKIKVTNQNLKLASRAVGSILHRNTAPTIPCHRVVTKDGRIAKGYAFGGAEFQRKCLEREGVKFLDSKRVDLKSSQWLKE